MERPSINNNTRMTITDRFRCRPVPVLSLLFFLLLCTFLREGRANSQSYSVVNPVILISEIPDLRLLVIENKTNLDQRISHGVICVARRGRLDNAYLEEHSTNTWKTVRDACRDLKILERSKQRSQIRVIKRDAIVQSSIDPPGSTGNGLTDEFLRTPLQAGDVIIFTVIFD